MAFRLADVKKTVRSRSDGERYLHPKILSGPAAVAQIGLALAYFNARLGRARREVDPETLVRFFGDPKVARGVVACLGSAYRWRPQQFRDVLDARAVAWLVSKGVATPCDLRLFLYDALNAGGAGFLAPEREDNLRPLARRLRLTPAKLDQLVALDAEENAVLVRVGPVPRPEDVVARYNFNAVDTILRNSIYVELHGIGGAARVALEDACNMYAISYSWQGDVARLHSHADAFGSYARAGLRLTRALYTALAGAPGLCPSGHARVQLPGSPAILPVGKESVAALTAGTGIIRCGVPWPELRAQWDRSRAAGEIGGWRLLTAPEPVVTQEGLALAPLACRREETDVMLWPVHSPAGLEDARVLIRAGLDVLPVVRDSSLADALDGLPHAHADDGAAGVVAALTVHWGGGRVAAGEQALESLLAEVASRGFIPAAEVATALGCASVDEAAARLRGLDASRGTYVTGLGLCSSTFAADMRKGLRRKRRAPAA